MAIGNRQQAGIPKSRKAIGKMQQANEMVPSADDALQGWGSAGEDMIESIDRHPEVSEGNRQQTIDNRQQWVPKLRPETWGDSFQGRGCAD